RHDRLRDADYIKLGPLDAVAQAPADGDDLRLAVHQDLARVAHARLVLERAHERAPDAGAAEGTPHRDALGLHASVVAPPEPRRAVRPAPPRRGEGREERAGAALLPAAGHARPLA